MEDYYEELWERLPADLHPPDLDRRRAFALANVTAGQRVLDLGCGTGDLTADLARAGAHVVGVDVAEGAVRRARARHPELDVRRAPIDCPLPFDDGSFDVVWSSEVIEHVADTARWLSEVRRVL
ncbi:MAG: class I SAM-dependent methyltransferase, partial [Solirubrobacteraceae bacterium]